MGIIDCGCGATYAPKDSTDQRRHERTAKHLNYLKAIRENSVTTEAFTDLDDETSETPEPTPIEKPKRTRRTKTLASFDALDATDAAKSFTEQERITISNSVSTSKGVRDPNVSPEEIADAFVEATVASAPDVNTQVLDDLRAYVIGVVQVVRADGNGETPKQDEPKAKREPKPKPVAKVEAKPEPKAKATKTPKVVNVGDHKACRVCGQDKPLTDYRVKSSRPDGRDTICAVCAKAWDEAHKAAKAAAK
jgi:hypothetical protein